MAIIAGAIGFGIVEIVAGSEEVMVASDFRGAPTSVPYKGRVSFVVDLDRREACPGDVVTIYSSIGLGPPAVVTLRKPSTYVQVRTFNDIKVSQELPDTVTPGRWRQATSLVSRCATRTWIDLLYTFEFEVTP